MSTFDELYLAMLGFFFFLIIFQNKYILISFNPLNRLNRKFVQPTFCFKWLYLAMLGFFFFLIIFQNKYILIFFNPLNWLNRKFVQPTFCFKWLELWTIDLYCSQLSICTELRTHLLKRTLSALLTNRAPNSSPRWAWPKLIAWPNISYYVEINK